MAKMFKLPGDREKEWLVFERNIRKDMDDNGFSEEVKNFIVPQMKDFYFRHIEKYSDLDLSIPEEYRESVNEAAGKMLTQFFWSIMLDQVRVFWDMYKLIKKYQDLENLYEDLIAQKK